MRGNNDETKNLSAAGGCVSCPARRRMHNDSALRVDAVHLTERVESRLYHPPAMDPEPGGLAELPGCVERRKSDHRNQKQLRDHLFRDGIQHPDLIHGRFCVRKAAFSRDHDGAHCGPACARLHYLHKA